MSKLFCLKLNLHQYTTATAINHNTNLLWANLSCPVSVKHLTHWSSAVIGRCHRFHIFFETSKLDKRINLVEFFFLLPKEISVKNEKFCLVSGFKLVIHYFALLSSSAASSVPSLWLVFSRRLSSELLPNNHNKQLYLQRNRAWKLRVPSLPPFSFLSRALFPPLFLFQTLPPLISFGEVLDNDIAGNRQSLTELVIMN